MSIPGEAGSETSDDASPNPNPTPMDDGGTDGPTVPEGGCAPEGSACSVNDSVKGLCKASSCTACVDTTDDALCKTAYGAGFANGNAVCSGGVCVAGDCHLNTDCAGNKICGLDTPNTCASCTSDSACKTSYGADFVCNKTTGGCETNAVACTNADAGACTGNTADICCAASAGAAGTCTPGNCCSAAQCGAATPNCVNHVCTGCAAVADGVYWVDPSVSAADNLLATGVKTPTCAFRSITSALAAIGSLAPAPVTVKIIAGAPALGPNESFPIIVPTNVTITSENTASPATILVPAGKEGFVLASPASGLTYLTIDGQANTALDGVLAVTGSSSTTTMVNHVTIKSFSGRGIVVRNAPGKTTGGGLSIGPGVSSTGNGTAAAPASGLHVSGNGVAVITGTAAAETHFDSNTEDGIRVDDAAQVTIDGVVGGNAPTSGTVTTNQNGNAGLVIQQTPGAAVPVNTVTGLTAWKTTAGPGIRIFGGSSVKLRASSALGNATDGVHVKAFVSGITVTNDTSKIDLGASAGVDPGKNVLQAIAGQSPNTGVGICLEVQDSGQLLSAYGNTFITAPVPGSATPVVSIDCSTTAGAIKRGTGSGACLGGIALGVIGNTTVSNKILTPLCTN